MNTNFGRSGRVIAALLLALCALPGAQAARADMLTVGQTQASMYQTIQDAVNNANPNDVILVADGTYTGVKNHDIDFGGIDLTVQSASSDPTKCIIDCQQAGRGFAIQNGETSKSVITGFTIKNGKTSANGGGIYVSSISNPTISNCLFINNSAYNGGGTSGASVTNCVFTSNSAGYYGGGMYNGTAINCSFTKNTASYYGGGGAYNITATNCVFTSNNAFANQYYSGSGGGGMSSGVANNCIFNGNTTGYMGGGAYNITANNCSFTANSAYEGGGLYSGTAINCSFTDNSAGYYGGGAVAITALNCVFTGNIVSNGVGGGLAGSATATYCAFINNSATGTNGFAGGAYAITADHCVFYYNSTTGNGGGIYGSSMATDCVFFGNTANGNGGAVSDASLYFCTVAGNTAKGSYGGGVYNTGSNTVTNSVIYNNTSAVNGPNVKNDGGTLTVTYSDIQRSYPGTGNINADPLFVNFATGDLHIGAGSPCIDKALSSGGPPTDLDGGNRIAGKAPDMGAYETGNPGIGGTVNMLGLVPTAAPQNVTFQLRAMSGGGDLITRTIGVLPNGAFRLYNLPSANYTLWIKPDKFLAVTVLADDSSGFVSGLAADFTGGDANNDNSVDSTDFGLLIGAFNTSAAIAGSDYDIRADFNGDGSVDSTDFGILIGAYNSVGAP